MSNGLVTTTVTYLEIKSVPKSLPRQPAGLRLALMLAEDVPVHFYRYLYTQVGRDWLWVERLNLNDDVLAAQIHRPEVRIFVLYGRGAPAGYYELLSRPKSNSAHLAYFGLMPEWTGQHIGPWLLGTAVATAFETGISRLTVNTCTLDHPAALQTYQRLGFAPFAQESRSFRPPPGYDRRASADVRNF